LQVCEFSDIFVSRKQTVKLMYKRVLLKLSGESLGGPAGKGLDEASLGKFAKEIAKAVKAGYQIAIVNGGGNIFRGIQGMGKGYDRVTGDRMGMLATVINSLALSCALRTEGIEAEVFTATNMAPLAQLYTRDNAVKVMENGGVALISGGTGNPFFSTDSGAALRALEISADAVLKGTRVDGVYTADPEKDPTAVKYDELTFQEALVRHLKVMDQTAFALCEQGPVPIVVFDINTPGGLLRVLQGEKIGTVVHA
jgi:uridylate kinase